MTDRIGQTVIPNNNFFFRPYCKVVESQESSLMGSPDTLHIIEYPSGDKKAVWESEWPGYFKELIAE